MAIERNANLSDEVAEGRSSVRAEEERVERAGWIVKREGAELYAVGYIELQLRIRHKRCMYQCEHFRNSASRKTANKLSL